MKLARIIIAVFIGVFFALPVMAEGYTMLVIPNSSIDTAKKNSIGNVDIEELLARKFIDRLEYTGRAFAPTIRVLKISIMNNPNFQPNAVNPFNNAKILSNSYGVPNVLIISSKTVVVNSAKQKAFWNKLDLPVIAGQEANVQLVTSIKLYNIKENEVLWSDVYYKKLLLNGNGSNTAKIEYINNYYDELISKVINNMKETKETHAIMLTKRPEISNDSEPVVMSKVQQPIKIESVQKVSNTKIINNLSIKEKNTPVKNKELATKIKTPKTEPNIFSKFKDSVRLKYDDIKQERELKKFAQETKTEKEINPTPKTTKVKLEKKDQKTVQKWIKERQEKFAQSKIKKETVKKEKPVKIVKEKPIKQVKEKPVKIVKEKPIKQVKEKPVKIVKEKPIKQVKEKPVKIVKEKPIKQVKEKPVQIVKEKPIKPQKEKISTKFKAKFSNMKAKYDENRANKMKARDENIKYSNVILQDQENTSSANKYIQIKPRNNSRNYVPKFDESVNDI